VDSIDHETAIDFWLLAFFRIKIIRDANRNQAEQLILLNAKPVRSGLHAVELETPEFV
jgi:hypothetical protein